MLMYADDTTMYCNIDQNVDEDIINNELAKIGEWLIANKLSLNTIRKHNIWSFIPIREM